MRRRALPTKENGETGGSPEIASEMERRRRRRSGSGRSSRVAFPLSHHPGMALWLMMLTIGAIGEARVRQIPAQALLKQTLLYSSFWGGFFGPRKRAKIK